MVADKNRSALFSLSLSSSSVSPFGSEPDRWRFFHVRILRLICHLLEKLVRLIIIPQALYDGEFGMIPIEDHN
jgi:hypothetical protein